MFKIIRFNCCGLDVHKTWIYACIGITDANGRTEYKESRFKSFSWGLRNLSDWLAKYSCTEVCMEPSGKYWIPVFNILEKSCKVTLAHPKYTKPQKGNKTDRKDARWICDLFMCGMIKGNYLKPLLVQVANALIKSKQHPEFRERYRRLKARRGHKKAIIAICRMLLTAIWNVLSKAEPYCADGFLDHRPSHS